MPEMSRSRLLPGLVTAAPALAVAFAVHALDSGAYWIHSLAEKGKRHGRFVAVEHGEGVEDVERAEDVKSLEVGEEEHGEFGG